MKEIPLFQREEKKEEERIRKARWEISASRFF
jgi:hypothetical protein